jgi:short-subunit dehydrogenase
MKPWTDLIVCITGANRGIGYGLAKLLSTKGANLLLVGRTPLSPKQIQELKDLGCGSIQFMEADLSSPQSVEKISDRLSKIEIDILFNNAGLLTGGLIEDQNPDEIRKMLEVNLYSPIALTKALIPGMVNRKFGLIINHSSISGLVHLPCASTYAASKAGLTAFSNSIRLELTGTGVKVLTLHTPGVDTDMFHEIGPKYQKNFRPPETAITVETYCLRILKSMEKGLSDLRPSLFTSEGLLILIFRFWKSLGERIALSRFRR